MAPKRPKTAAGFALLAAVVAATALPSSAAAFETAYPPAPIGLGPYLPLLVAPHYGEGIGAGRGHEGQDLFAPAGTPEVAVLDAVVLESGTGYQGGRGNYVSLYSPARHRTYNYFHMLSAPLVDRGDAVLAGQPLGRLGCSGSCWGDHLHFEVRRGRDPYGPVIDPRPLLERSPLAPTARQPGVGPLTARSPGSRGPTSPARAVSRRAGSPRAGVSRSRP
ncbi:MAG: M23 family metallopeptidase [Solirubrobacterales bacterium]